MLVELIFALILTLELVPEDVGTYTVDVLEDTELTMELRAEREEAEETARVFGQDGAEILTVERSRTAGHLYTAFPEEGDPSVLDVGPALDEIRSFETEPVQTISAAPDSSAGEIEWMLVRREELFYLGVPSQQTLLIVRTDDRGDD